MTRIIAGSYGGRRIAAPAGAGTRPTSDRVREALFGSFDHAGVLYGRRFLDLYAGSGAIGLEAASRGAAHVLAVESDPRALKVIRDNVATLRAGGVVSVATGTVAAVLAARPAGGGYDAAFADPPYAMPEEEITALLAALVAGGWLASGAPIVLERSRRSPEPVWVDGITPERSRRYGDTALWYGRRS